MKDKSETRARKGSKGDRKKGKEPTSGQKGKANKEESNKEAGQEWQEKR